VLAGGVDGGNGDGIRQWTTGEATSEVGVLRGVTIDHLILGKKGSTGQKGRFIYVN
jgi:hypothetical protein